MIVLAGRKIPVALPEHFIWLTLNQIAALAAPEQPGERLRPERALRPGVPWSKRRRASRKTAASGTGGEDTGNDPGNAAVAR